MSEWRCLNCWYEWEDGYFDQYDSCPECLSRKIVQESGEAVDKKENCEDDDY